MTTETDVVSFYSTYKAKKNLTEAQEFRPRPVFSRFGHLEKVAYPLQL